jgi:hypothetical protein
MSLVELFRRRPRDPRAMPFFLHLIDWRQTQRIWDAGYRERLAAMTDDQIVWLAGAPVCLR